MKRIRRNDRGSALVIALAFLSLFGILTAVTLSSAESSLHLDKAAKVSPPNLYAADAAIEQAIQAVRYDHTLGRQGESTCGVAAPVNGETIYLCRTGQPGSGAVTGGGSSPTLGILTLATAPEVGYQQGSNAIVRLDGGLYSNSSISFGGAACPSNNCSQLNLCANNEKVVTDGQITINSKTVTSATAGFVSGDVGTVMKGSGIPAGTVIDSVTNATTAIIHNAATRTASNVTLEFREFPLYQSACNPPPGTKGKITALGACDTSHIVAVQFNCPNGVADNTIGVDPGYVPTQNTWATVQSVPACGSSAIVEFQPGRYTNLAGLNALTNGTCNKLFWFRSGVYDFDLGGKWTIGNKDVTVLAGEKTWNRVVTDAQLTAGSTTIVSATANFTSADVNRYVNSAVNLPYGAQITSVTSATTAVLSRPANSNATAARLAIGDAKAMCVEDTGSDHPGAELVFSGTTQLEVTNGRFEVCAPANGFAQQVGIFGVKTSVGSLTAQSGCLVQTPYPTAGCAFIKTSGNQSMLLVHGTLYAPAAVVDLGLTNIGYQVVSRGILARVLALALTPSSDFTDPVIFSPDFGSVVPADRSVLVRACSAANCPAGSVKISALVDIKDSDASCHPSFCPGYAVKVRSWSIER